uniref:Uncharacterized protein n=1 Tax=Setaria viridis TaxID=4556 RepID=A0A4U6T5Z7_SETVI|nr:hypothetical protein SEVIR_9G412166v2 [Setaria viridis]
MAARTQREHARGSSLPDHRRWSSSPSSWCSGDRSLTLARSSGSCTRATAPSSPSVSSARWSSSPTAG